MLSVESFLIALSNVDRSTFMVAYFEGEKPSFLVHILWELNPTTSKEVATLMLICSYVEIFKYR